MFPHLNVFTHKGFMLVKMLPRDDIMQILYIMIFHGVPFVLYKHRCYSMNSSRVYTLESTQVFRICINSVTKHFLLSITHAIVISTQERSHSCNFPFDISRPIYGGPLTHVQTQDEIIKLIFFNIHLFYIT